MDDLIDAARELVIRTQWADVGALQRRLRVSYGRAHQLLDQLEAEGVVGPRRGSLARDVLRKS
ncbi:DNA translocase FtsK [Streptomyces harbinensis]|uniref:DNA translocase FtsK n=1 Tax=Streptomyces harbinensis TaxID=1176198 RepID=UPI00369C89B9